MTFLDKITGNDMTRELKGFEARIDKLPVDYKVAWEEVKTAMWTHNSDIIGRNMMPILDGIVGLLEEGMSEGMDARAILGDDIEGFCLALLGEDAAMTYRDKWRQQLNENVAKKLAKLEG